jgi:hypothetical protein
MSPIVSTAVPLTEWNCPDTLLGSWEDIFMMKVLVDSALIEIKAGWL